MRSIIASATRAAALPSGSSDASLTTNTDAPVCDRVRVGKAAEHADLADRAGRCRARRVLQLAHRTRVGAHVEARQQQAVVAQHATRFQRPVGTTHEIVEDASRPLPPCPRADAFDRPTRRRAAKRARAPGCRADRSSRRSARREAVRAPSRTKSSSGVCRVAVIAAPCSDRYTASQPPSARPASRPSRTSPTNRSNTASSIGPAGSAAAQRSVTTSQSGFRLREIRDRAELGGRTLRGRQRLRRRCAIRSARKPPDRPRSGENALPSYQKRATARRLAARSVTAAAAVRSFRLDVRARDHVAKSRLLGAQVLREPLRRAADRNRAELAKTFGDLRLAQMRVDRGTDAIDDRPSACPRARRRRTTNRACSRAPSRFTGATPGSTGSSRSPITPSATSLPSRTCGSAVGTLSPESWIWPPSRSVVAWLAPLYGTCTMSTFASCFSISSAM